MQLAIPVIWIVMCVLDNLSEHRFWFKDEIFLGYHAPADCEDGSKQTEVEQDGAIFRNLKSQEQLRVDKGD